jgi:Right handed beta helix region
VITGRVYQVSLAVIGAAVLASSLVGPPPAAAGQSPRVIRVPQDAATPQDAVEAASSGDVILLDRGRYPGGLLIPEGNDGITIRGVDRNEVVFDGNDETDYAIEIEADGVTVENMSAHNFDGNGFYWEGVDGFTGRYLTVWNVRLYGLYAIASRGGLIEQSLVSGAADAAFYIGECKPCDTVITDVVAQLSAIGYSGTNASQNMVIRDSLWDRNGTGIMPNSYIEERFVPQGSAAITGNTVRGSGSVPTPSGGPLGGYTGLGIALAGGVDNLVENNTVEGSAHYGIVMFPTLQTEGPPWVPERNTVRDNDVSGSGTADLAVSAGSGAGNCFEGNRFDTSLPVDIEVVGACAEGGLPEGDAGVAEDLFIPVPEALERAGDRPDYRGMPAPGAQGSMPDAEALPESAPSEDEPGGIGWPIAAVVVAAGLVAGGAGFVAVRRSRRSVQPKDATLR